MKKLIFAVLCFLSTNAYCAWYNVDKSAVVKSYIYIESIRPAGNFYEAWILYDLKQPLIKIIRKLSLLFDWKFLTVLIGQTQKRKAPIIPAVWGKVKRWKRIIPVTRNGIRLFPAPAEIL